MFRAARIPLQPAMARLPHVQARAMSSVTPHQPQKGKLRALWAQVPVDVYPLLFAVSGACVLGVFTLGHHLMTDHTLRLLPDRAKAQN